jgi:hypothetical protein
MEPLYLDWDPEERKRAIAYWDVFADPAFVPCRWEVPEPRVVDGKTIHSLGWPEYDPRVEEFLAIAWNTPGIDPYVGEAWDTFWANCWTHPAPFESASVGDIRRFLMLVKRRERFGDGTIESAFKKGLILAALQRLRALTLSNF